MIVYPIRRIGMFDSSLTDPKASRIISHLNQTMAATTRHTEATEYPSPMAFPQNAPNANRSMAEVANILPIISSLPFWVLIQPPADDLCYGSSKGASRRRDRLLLRHDIDNAIF